VRMSWKANSHSITSLFLTAPLNIPLLYLVWRTIYLFIWLSDMTQQQLGRNTWLQYIPLAWMTLVQLAFQEGYNKIARMTTDWEGHPSKKVSDSHLLVKRLFFNLFVWNCGLFYFAFWLRDLQLLHNLLTTTIITKTVVGKMINLTQTRDQKKHALASDSEAEKQATEQGEALSSQNEEKTPAEQLEKEISLEDFSPDTEYMQLLLQFSDVTMFAVAFPLAPFLALLINMFEIWGDFKSLINSRRSMIQSPGDIGMWYTALNVVSFISVLTNCGLMTMVSTYTDFLVPDDLEFFLTSTLGRFIVAIGFEHVLIGVKFMVASLIEDRPWKMQQMLAKEALETKEENELANRIKTVVFNLKGLDMCNKADQDKVDEYLSSKDGRVILEKIRNQV